VKGSSSSAPAPACGKAESSIDFQETFERSQLPGWQLIDKVMHVEAGSAFILL